MQLAAIAATAAEFLNQYTAIRFALCLGFDASLVLVYRDEYRKALGERRGDFEVQLFHEWLQQQQLPVLQSDAVFKLFAHCTQKTSASGDGEKAGNRFLAVPV